MKVLIKDSKSDSKSSVIICFVEIIGRPLITIVHIRVSLSLSFIVTNMLIYLAGNKFLLENFIKFNYFQINPFVVKRVLKLLNRTFKNYYALIIVKSINSQKIKSKYFEETNEI